jgi:dihydroceramidase
VDVPSAGFWGPVTSSVDWCEANYQHSRYVCEFYNTLSSAAILLAGAIGIALHGRTLERRFFWAFFAIVAVGAGSIAFHATLRFECQVLDEVPMLYTALVMIYIVLENRRERRFGAWLPAALVAYGMVVTSLDTLTRGKLQFYLFQTSFASMELFALYRVCCVYRASENQLVRNLFWTGITSYAIAILCWFVDLKACGIVGGVLPAHGIPNPQLHAWWHVLVSNGLYVLTLMLASHRLGVLGRTAKLRFALGSVPYVAICGDRDE